MTRFFVEPAWLDRNRAPCLPLIPWASEFATAPPLVTDAYARNGRAYFTRTGPAECDFVLCPAVWRDPGDNALVQQLQRQARQWGKPLVVFCETDSEDPFPIPGVFAFRSSLRRSRRLPTEFPTPAFVPDHWLKMTPAPEIAPVKRDRPSVGFCGYIDTAQESQSGVQRAVSRAVYWNVLARPNLERWLRRGGLRLTRSEGKRVRYQSVGVVSRCAGIQTNFILRRHFWNGALRVPEQERAAHFQRSLDEFRDNVLGSDYTLCPRGGGNWSYRLYETLCLGRVPVFFNTDCVLPYESLIRWREICVWVEGDQIEQTAEAILRHYRAHSPEEMAELKRRCRQVWLDYLGLDGYFRNFHHHVELFDGGLL